MQSKSLNKKRRSNQRSLDTILETELDIKKVILTLVGLITLTSLWSVYFLSSSVLKMASTSPSIGELGVPLASFGLLERSGVTVRSSGSITNLSATMDGNGVSWQSIGSTKFLYFNNTNHDAYGRLRINNHTQIQKLNLKEAFTISGQVYLNQYPLTPDHPNYIIYTDSSILGQGNSLVILPGGKVRLYANSGNISYSFTANNDPIPFNQWVTITGSFNATTSEMLIDINDKRYASSNLNKVVGTSRNFTTRPIIGMSGTWRDGLIGYVRNIKIWNKSLLNGQYYFIDSIKTGFNNDLNGQPKAKWIGTGLVDVLHINAAPTTTIRLTGEGEEYGFESKVSFLYLFNLRKNSPVLSRKKTTWAAWTDSDGLINLALNLPLEKAEDNAIGSLQTATEWRSWDPKVDWYADIKNFLGFTRFNDGWVRKGNDDLTHIFLGEAYNVGNEIVDLKANLEVLKQLKIIDNIIYD